MGRLCSAAGGGEKREVRERGGRASRLHHHVAFMSVKSSIKIVGFKSWMVKDL